MHRGPGSAASFGDVEPLGHARALGSATSVCLVGRRGDRSGRGWRGGARLHRCPGSAASCGNVELLGHTRPWECDAGLHGGARRGSGGTEPCRRATAPHCTPVSRARAAFWSRGDLAGCRRRRAYGVSPLRGVELRAGRSVDAKEPRAMWPCMTATKGQACAPPPSVALSRIWSPAVTLCGCRRPRVSMLRGGAAPSVASREGSPATRNNAK